MRMGTLILHRRWWERKRGRWRAGLSRDRRPAVAPQEDRRERPGPIPDLPLNRWYAVTALPLFREPSGP
jgi:hypothetical protein